tara:strand:+ start:366 stop:626 length:261 start_codon:yes stop_codon:yes gene_type:complete
MGGVARVFTAPFKAVSKVAKSLTTGGKKKRVKNLQKIASVTQSPIARTAQQTSARLGSVYGTRSTLLGGATGITEQAKTSRTLLGS